MLISFFEISWITIFYKQTIQIYKPKRAGPAPPHTGRKKTYPTKRFLKNTQKDSYNGLIPIKNCPGPIYKEVDEEKFQSIAGVSSIAILCYLFILFWECTHPLVWQFHNWLF